MKNTKLDESENEFDVDEPDEIQNNHSDDDWTPEASGRRHSSRLRTTARKRFTEEATSSEEVSEEDESEDDYKRRRSRQRKPPGRRPIKKQRVSSTTHNDNSDSQQGDGEAKSNSNSDSEPSSTTASTKAGREFSSGAFVVLKTDYTNEEKPPIWKIDGKALLQKYVPFEEDGVTLYKNTSVYSGWSVTNKDQYFAATVVFKQHNRKAHVVEFKKELVKTTPEEVIENAIKQEVDEVEENNEDGAEDEEEEEEEEDEGEEGEDAQVKEECSESDGVAPEVEEVDE